MSSSKPRKGWYWTVERPREMLLDVDKGFSEKDFAHSRRIFTRETGIKIELWQIKPSQTPGHYHVRLVLGKIISWDERFAFGLFFKSDRHREILAYARTKEGFENQYLVVDRSTWGAGAHEHFCTHKDWRKCPCLPKIQPDKKHKRRSRSDAD